MLSAVAARKAGALQQPTDSQNGPTGSEVPKFLASSFDSDPRAAKLSHTVPALKQKRKRPLQASNLETCQLHPSRSSPPLSRNVDHQVGDDATEEVRGWSPSRPAPLNDSDEESGDELPSVNEINGIKLPEQHAGFLEVPLFIPQNGRNCFKYSPEGGVYIILRNNEALCFVGTVELVVLRGIISMLGTPLHPSLISYRVFAPKTHPLPVITTIGLSSSPPPSDLPTDLIDQCNISDAILFLRPLQTGIEGLGDVCKPFSGMFRKDDLTVESGSHDVGVAGLSLLCQPSASVYPFVLPGPWSDALCSLSSPPKETAPANPRIVLVKGAKRTGKSTFARTLLNQLTTKYARVAFLECDLGQSEFTPGGMVALNLVYQPVFGPPFTHPEEPYSAHYIGSSTPRSLPSLYLSAITALMQTYRLELEYSPINEASAINDRECRECGITPLVINTQGWAKGMGADLLRRIEEIVEPTHVVDIGNESYWGNGTGLFPWLGRQATTDPQVSNHSSSVRQAWETTILSAIPPLAPSNPFTSSDYRALNIISYFYSNRYCSPSTPPEVRATSISWSTACSLVERAPFEVDTNIAFDAIVTTGSGSEDLVPHEVFHALNCSIVGLVDIGRDPSSMTPTSRTQIHLGSGVTAPYVQRAPAPDPMTSKCLGLALIRGVSPSSSTLQLLSPISSVSLLAKARVLIKGELEMPIWGFLDHARNATGDGVEKVCGLPWESTPYLQYVGGDRPYRIAGGAVRRARRNLMRKAQA